MLHLFSLYDARTETYGNPMCVSHPELAIRGFEEATKEPQSFINKNPYDYVLVKIGTFNPDTGEVKPINPPLVIKANKPEN